MPAKELAAAPKRVPPAAERDQPLEPQSALAEAQAAMPPQEPGTLSADDSADQGPRPGFVRQPFGSMAFKLNAPKREHYHRHWFNEVLDRIQQATAAGYTHVKEESSGVPMKRVVGVAKGGGPQIAYLMEIPEEWFKEDMARQQAKVDEIDKALRGGDIARKQNDERYVPKDGIAFKEE